MTRTALQGKLRLPRGLDTGRASLPWYSAPGRSQRRSFRESAMAGEGPFPREACPPVGNETRAQQTQVRAVAGVPSKCHEKDGLPLRTERCGFRSDRLGLQLARDNEEHLNKRSAKARPGNVQKGDNECPPLSSTPFSLICLQKVLGVMWRLSPTGPVGWSRPERIYFGH